VARLTVIQGSGPAEDIEEPNWVLLIPAPIDDLPDNSLAWRAYAAREWRRLLGALRDAGTLASENRHQMQRLVLAYLRYDMAASQVFASQAIVKAPKTKVPMMNLWLVEMRAADGDATTAEMELGISPRRRRATTKAKTRTRTVGAADGYLSAVKKI
jgi:phage terminase small subunit